MSSHVTGQESQLIVESHSSGVSSGGLYISVSLCL